MAKRPGYEAYLPMLSLQRKSAEKFGHSHLTIADFDVGPRQETVDLPQSLMKAMIAGIIARLKMGGNSHILFVDVDCLIASNLTPAFASKTPFDLMLTRRPNPISPINNGAMYVHRNGIAKAIPFFEQALMLCRDHWGGDQEAISLAAGPVPDESGIGVRCGANVTFVSMKSYNSVPKALTAILHPIPYVVHFKGETKKWMADYARMFVLR